MKVYRTTVQYKHWMSYSTGHVDRDRNFLVRATDATVASMVAKRMARKYKLRAASVTKIKLVGNLDN